MASCLSRWMIAASLAWLGTAAALGWTRAGEGADEAVEAQVPILVPFHPAYRARPARQPAPAPAAVPGAPRRVQAPLGSDVDGRDLPPESDTSGKLPGPGDADQPPTDAAAPTDPEGDAVDETPTERGEKDEEDRAAHPPATAPKRELSSAMKALRDRVRSTLDSQRRWMLSARQNTATEVMAACLAFGCETDVLRADQANRTINGVTHLCWNYPCDGFVPLTLADGHVAARIGYGLQEHR